MSDQQLIVAFEDGIFSWSPGSERVLMNSLDERPQNRTNDGKIGPDGQYWFGTMDDGETLDGGALYSLHKSGQLKRHLHRDLQYFRLVTGWAFRTCRLEGPTDLPLSGDWCRPRLPRVFVDLQGTTIYPDGSCMDSEGCLWDAQWDGHRVVRYAPDGTIRQIISVLFSAHHLLLVVLKASISSSTASVSLSDDLESQPLAGRVLG